ncbi:MAG: methylenetetrahydrofolate reductase C-terminal domain-containing protein [Promethearchaeota archaeon]
MIIVKMKPLDEIYEMIAPYSNVLIAGCDGCCQPPRSIHEANELGKLLEIIKKEKGEKFNYKAITVLRQCDDHIAKEALHSLINDYDAVISMSCGIGVQVLTKVFPQKITFPAQNTMFNGMEDHENEQYAELCNQCGDCLLGVTGGICPVAGCAKALMNGPCGGQIDGKCEVGDYKIDCAWVNIYKRLKSLDRLDLFKQYRPKRDYRNMTSPSFISLLELEEVEEEIKEKKEAKAQ